MTRLVAAIVLFGAIPLIAQAQEPMEQASTAPRNATYCELSRDPVAFNHQLVRLTAFVTYGFEDFSIADPECPTQGFAVWVIYGGTTQSSTIYCCPGEASEKERPAPLRIEGVSIPLEKDANFAAFQELLRKEEDTTVRVTAVGRFFSGDKQLVGGKTEWRGAGHLGCCSLFVIQRVESFEAHTRRDVDYTAEAGWYESEGCNANTVQYQRHVSVRESVDAQEAIAEQRMAERGDTPWAFTDPARVATESLKKYFPRIPKLRLTRKSPTRYVFRWNNGKDRVLVVVTRPYWLSFYADSKTVVWVATMIKEVGC